MRLQKKGVAKMFAHLKVRTKLIILTAAAAISMLVMGIINMNGMNQSYKQSVSSIKDLLYDDYDTQIKGQVENVITLLEEEYENFQNGLITEDEAKKAAADIVRELRYGDSGYFWIDTYDGDNIVLPGSKTEGTNRLNEKDSHGKEMIKEIIQNGRQADGGYTEYYYPKQGSTEDSLKRAYSKAFEPWQWVIGTGNYTDDLEDHAVKNNEDVKKIFTRTRRLSMMSMAISILLMTAIALLIVTDIAKSLKAASEELNHMAAGD